MLAPSFPISLVGPSSARARAQTRDSRCSGRASLSTPLPAMTDADSIKTIFDPSTCLKRGFAPVATSPSRAPSPHNLYYEVHGDPSPDAAKLVFVMGALCIPSPTIPTNAYRFQASTTARQSPAAPRASSSLILHLQLRVAQPGLLLCFPARIPDPRVRQQRSRALGRSQGPLQDVGNSGRPRRAP